MKLFYRENKETKLKVPYSSPSDWNEEKRLRKISKRQRKSVLVMMLISLQEERSRLQKSIMMSVNACSSAWEYPM